MFSAATLNDLVYDDWRDAEEAVFSAMERLRRGEMPSLEGASPAALRRLGYLADMTLLFLDPVRHDALKRLKDGMRSRLEDWPEGEPLPAIPCAGRRRPPVCFDDVGAAWNVAPGVSLARFRAEAPARPSS